MVNKEKILFFIVCLTSIIFLGHYHYIAPHHNDYPTHKENKSGEWQRMATAQDAILPTELTIPALAAREMFLPNSESKKMVPVILALPELEQPRALLLLPFPAIAAQHWSSLIVAAANQSATTPAPETVQPPSSDLISDQPDREPGAYAQKLVTLVHDDDIIRTKNGREWRGKIVRETATEIILSVPGPMRTLHVPRENIAQIMAHNTLEDVLREELKKLGTDDLAAHLKLAQAANELDLPKFTEELFGIITAKFPSNAD